MKEKNKKFKRFLNDRKMIIFAICIILFIILTILVLTNNTEKIDNYYNELILNIRSDSLTDHMCVITQVGGAYSLIALSLLLLFIIKKKRIPLFIIINLISAFFMNQLFKIIFSRSRPDGIFLSYANGYSYPSGHSMVSMAYFIFIIYLIYKYLDNKILKILLYISLFNLIFLVGFSRIYLGMHYFTDVIGGHLLGISYAMCYIKLVDKKGYLI